MLTKWGQKKCLCHRRLRLYAAVMAVVLAVGLMPIHKVAAASPVPGFNVKDEKNEYTYSSMYRCYFKVYDSIPYVVSSAGYNKIEYETTTLGETESKMYIATSKATYDEGKYKVAMIRQIVNPFRPYSRQFNTLYAGRVKLAKLYFPFLSGHDEMDSRPQAVSPTGSSSASWSLGGSMNSSFVVSGNISLGRQESYGKNAVTVKNTRGADKVRMISYEMSCDYEVGKKFQEAVNQFSENSFTAEYNVAYLRNGNTNPSDVNKRITIEASFVSTLSMRTNSAIGQFNLSMY